MTTALCFGDYHRIMELGLFLDTQGKLPLLVNNLLLFFSFYHLRTVVLTIQIATATINTTTNIVCKSMFGFLPI